MSMSSVAKMMRRNDGVRRLLRELVKGGMTRADAARTSGVGYDCAVMWTRDIGFNGQRRYKCDVNGLDDHEPGPALEPTGSLVGSAERVEVYRQRVENNEHLYHRWDNQLAERNPYD